MSYVDAQNILDMRRAGANMPQYVVEKALEMTGDKVPDALQETLQEAIQAGA